MSLAEFIDTTDAPSKTLTVLNDDEPAPLIRMLEQMVDSPEVDVQRSEPPSNGPANVVVLADEQSEQLAISSIKSVGDSVLMVNSDLYITGTRSLDEVDTPDVLANLDETTFTVSGKQKMLLIEISRHVESLAREASAGELHTGFQYLSRIEDERGTSRVYERLAATETDIYVYGVPDRVPDLDDSVTVCGKHSTELRDSWFVVHTDCADDKKAALVAKEVRDNEWTGFWTFETEVVDEIAAYLETEYLS